MPGTQLPTFLAEHPEAKSVLNGKLKAFCQLHQERLRFVQDAGSGFVEVVGPAPAPAKAAPLPSGASKASVAQMPSGSSSSAPRSEPHGKEQKLQKLMNIALQFKDHLDAVRLVKGTRAAKAAEFQSWAARQGLPGTNFGVVMKLLRDNGFGPHGSWSDFKQAPVGITEGATLVRTAATVEGLPASAAAAQAALSGPEEAASPLQAVVADMCGDAAGWEKRLVEAQSCLGALFYERQRALELAERHLRQRAKALEEQEAGLEREREHFSQTCREEREQLAREHKRSQEARDQLACEREQLARERGRSREERTQPARLWEPPAGEDGWVRYLDPHTSQYLADADAGRYWWHQEGSGRWFREGDAEVQQPS